MSKSLDTWSCPSADPAPPSRPDRRPRPTPRSVPPSAGRALLGLATAALASLHGGCGNDEEFTYPSTNLGGDVTINGLTVEEGTVSFQSLDPKNGHFADTRIVRGRYIAEKVPLGKNLIVISAFKVVGPKITGAGQPLPETGNLIPPQYQNGIELVVTSKTSRVDFKLAQVKAEPRPAPSGISGDAPGKPTP